MQARFRQITQTAAFNLIPEVEERVAKWPLRAHDRAGSDELQLTPGFPAKISGSRGSTVIRAGGLFENTSHPWRLTTRTVIALLVVSNVLGNVSLSRGLQGVGRLVSFSPWPYIHAFLNPMVALGVLLLIVWLMSQLSLLSRVDLSYVLPVTSVSYVLTALMGEFLLHEQVSTTRWLGIGLICLGVSLVARTAPRTVPAMYEAAVRRYEVVR